MKNKVNVDLLDEFIDENGNVIKGEKKISTDRSLIERVNKKIIIEDGRQLLI